MRQHVGEWLRRYLPAEIVSVAGALVAANVALALSDHNEAVIAIAGAWGETVAYYATMLVREFLLARRNVLEMVRDLVLEFGVGEALDSLFVRPALMYAAGQLLADVQAGVLVGKFGADIVFYIPTIAAYELRRKYLHRATA